MRVRVGTSGFSYKEWKGGFYPDDLKPAEMLRSYSGRLETVEINNTFYRMPSEKLLLGWIGQVPEEFRFAIKAHRRISHGKQLADADDATRRLIDLLSTLGDRLGPVLFQLPPYRRKDVDRLRTLLELLPDGCRASFEFRHASWFDDETYDLLRKRNAALVTADTDDSDKTEIVATASHGYLRLRRNGYTSEALEAWADRILEQPWSEAWVYFKHEETGPELALRLAEAVTERTEAKRG